MIIKGICRLGSETKGRDFLLKLNFAIVQTARLSDMSPQQPYPDGLIAIGSIATKILLVHHSEREARGISLSLPLLLRQRTPPLRISRFASTRCISCDVVSIQERAFQRSPLCAWRSRQTSADPCLRLLRAAFQPRSATPAVDVSLSAILECIRRHRAGCAAHGHPAAGSEHGRRATRHQR